MIKELFSKTFDGRELLNKAQKVLVNKKKTKRGKRARDRKS